MRAIFDANVLVSALLSWAYPERTVVRIIRAGFAAMYTLLLPEETVTELSDTISGSPYVAARVSFAQATAFIDQLRATSEELSPLSYPPELVSRDPKDDYLLASAQRGHADYLVTGDKDLLVLAGDPFPFRIVSPAAFLAVLEDAGLA